MLTLLTIATIMARLLSLSYSFNPSSLHLVTFIFLTSIFSLTSGNSTSFSHHLVLYECDPSRTVYRFQYDPNQNHDTPSLADISPDESLFRLTRDGQAWTVETPDRRSALHLAKFSFRVASSDLIVEVTGELRPCDDSSSTRCTILISVLASLSLLLFAGLALTLIVLKERRLPCFHKLTAWIRRARGGGSGNGDSNQEQQEIPPPPTKRSSALAPDDIDLEHLQRIYEKGINSRSNNSNSNGKPSTPIEDSPPPVPPVNKPRKSSLKPPRTEAYPAPSFSLQPDAGIQENPGEGVGVVKGGGNISPGILGNNNPALNAGRRKSMVTFNERTEIRS